MRDSEDERKNGKMIDERDGNDLKAAKHVRRKENETRCY